MPKYIVRYGSMRALGVLNTRGSDRFARGSRVIARTNRGLEVGEVLNEATEDAIARLKDASSGQILREMTTEDENELAHIESNLGKEFEACRKHVESLSLQMDLVDIEHVFGGERIVVYYLAEQRVDFRELVKRLASEFQTRIEMRQIGVRDEAKLLADYGDCGKPVCCNTHLAAMPPVSMKMAKLQKATLDPTKISGRCGRLKCCLRYEYDTYEELQKELPPIGSDIVTEHGNARVLSQEVLSQQLLIQGEDMRRMVIDANEVLAITRRGSGKRGKPKPRDRGKGEDRDKKEAAGDSRPAKTSDGGKSPPAQSSQTKSGEGKAGEGKSRSGKQSQGRSRDGKSRGGRPRGKSRDGKPSDGSSASTGDSSAAPQSTAEGTAENALPTAPPADENTSATDNTPDQSQSQSAAPADSQTDKPQEGPTAGGSQSGGKRNDGKSRRRRSNSRKPKRPE